VIKKTTLILDATTKADPLALHVLEALKEHIHKSGSPLLVLRPSEMKIHHCIGCFHCWLKTPGLCIFNDDGTKITHALSRANRIVFFTPLVFGTYSADIKNSIERSIGILLPTFKKWKGEMHHPLRYPIEPEFIGIGFADRTDDGTPELFRSHLMRNALNFHAQSMVTTVFAKNTSINNALEQLERALAKPEEIV
jgi:multimeric flavodoxin WrbA